MRAAPHAGSRRSRCRHPRAIALVLAVELVALAALGEACTPHAESRSVVRASAAVAPVAAPPFDDVGYWAIADDLQRRIEPLWNERQGIYDPGGGGVGPLVNAGVLLTYSVAAQAGHKGPARDDRRARLIARALVSAPVFIEHPAAHPARGSQPHAPGWTSSMHSATASQHLVYDSEIVDGLVHAWKARRELGLSDELANAIADRIHRAAQSRYWRWPTIRLNQINWYALIYAADATVTGRPAALAVPFRRQLDRFLARAPRNFGPGLRFHYLPDRPLNRPENVDSAEYANIVLSFSRFLGQARAAGMPPLRPDERSLLRRWVSRAVAGYWTHSGYLNWDSGLGFNRWHQAKKLGLAQQALIGVAQSPDLQPSAAWGRWTKWIFDRGLAMYERQPIREGGVAAALFFGVSKVPEPVGSAQLAAVRIESNAARAVEAGLGRMAAQAPPPLYAYDPDTGRLAVTTPAYNTAILPVNQRAFPYGGIELARLFDGEQGVAANIGGRGRTAFGVRLRDAAGRVVLDSQLGRRRVDRTVTPLRLTRAPSGVGARASSAGGRAYAGPFQELRAVGRVASSAGRVTSAHVFTARAIETAWTVARAAGVPRLSAEATFPTWGREAEVVAVLRDGSRRRVTSRGLALGRVRRFEVAGRDSGYTLVPLAAPAGAVVHIARPAAQSSAPLPGPTLCVEVAHVRRFRLAVRIVPEHFRTVRAS